MYTKTPGCYELSAGLSLRHTNMYNKATNASPALLSKLYYKDTKSHTNSGCFVLSHTNAITQNKAAASAYRKLKTKREP